MYVSLLWILTALPWLQLDPAGRDAALRELARTPLPARVAEAAHRFGTARYAASPLGEGEGRDSDPPMRFDAVDCLTLVEESMALALAPSFDQVLPTLDAIRYDGGVRRWSHRNHLMEAQWIPREMAAGFIADATRRYGGASTHTVVQRITSASWASPLGRDLALPAERRVLGAFALEVIPPREVAAKLAAAPEGLILVVVSAERPGRLTRVTHVGLLAHVGGVPVLRHASRSYGSVVDEPLEHFVARNLGYAPWTIAGFSVFEPRRPPGAASTGVVPDTTR